MKTQGHKNWNYVAQTFFKKASGKFAKINNFFLPSLLQVITETEVAAKSHNGNAADAAHLVELEQRKNSSNNGSGPGTGTGNDIEGSPEDDLDDGVPVRIDFTLFCNEGNVFTVVEVKAKQF